MFNYVTLILLEACQNILQDNLKYCGALLYMFYIFQYKINTTGMFKPVYALLYLYA